MTRFPPGPYTKESCKLLHNLVKSVADPSQSWPYFTVSIRGQAKTYKDAVKKLKTLENVEYAFTTETDVEPPEIAQRIVQEYKKKALTDKFEEIKHYFHTPEEKVIGDENTNPNVLASIEDNLELQYSTVMLHPPITLQLVKDDNTAVTLDLDLNNLSNSDATGCRESMTINPNVFQMEPERNDQLKINKETTPVTNANIDLQRIESRIVSLNADIKEVIRNQRKILSCLSQVGDISLVPTTGGKSFAEKYSLNLPFKTTGEFSNFNDNLSQNEDFTRDFELSLTPLLNPDNIPSKTAVNILKKYMSRDLALQYTVIKKVPGKEVLKNTLFFKFILDFMVQNHKKVDGRSLCEKEVYKTIGVALSNCKDWDGFRSKRVKLTSNDNSN
ncbi:uncharacterized protein [Prorops nasuta]|uniref:uncharacterized protein n=1 Tax=Prorops nasuta TaxID=863751 RepID=UPI0034CDD55E